MRYDCGDVPKGEYLVYVKVGRYITWRWVNVPDNPKATIQEVDCKFDPSSTGTVEVHVSDPMITQVRFLLANENGKLPDWGRRAQPYGTMVEVKKGRAIFKGLGAGKYVFYHKVGKDIIPKVSATKPTDVKLLGTVEVLPGKVVHVGKAKEKASRKSTRDSWTFGLLRHESKGAHKQERVQALRHGVTGHLDGGPIDCISDSRPGTKSAGQLASETRDGERNSSVEHTLSKPQNQQVWASDLEHRGDK